MLNAKADFLNSISRSRDLSALYVFLSEHVVAPFAFSDLLRYQIVHVVSAFDKLMHDLIRIGMVETFVGQRSPTDRYHAEPISISLHSQLIAASFPPKEVLFEHEIVRKLAHLSFPDPGKVCEGLALVWSEKHKWAKICERMGQDADMARTRLKLIVARRNAIVHEADMQPLTGEKTPIDFDDSNDNTNFVELCGITISDLLVET